jgi:hypothetical protein
MSYNYEQLRDLTDADLIKEFNTLMESAQVGPSFYREELARRESERLNDKMLIYTHELHYFTKWITIMAVMSTITAIISLIVSILFFLK